MEYKKADATHANIIASLALLLWPHHEINELVQDFIDELKNENSAVFLCLENGVAVGFAQFALRFDYVEGTHARPVGYLEGIYIKDQYRGQGIAGCLVRLGEMWALEKGCSQMASDCELNNTDSLHFHLGCGFTEINRIICFVKNITEK